MDKKQGSKEFASEHYKEYSVCLCISECEGVYPTSCSVRLSLKSRVLTAVQSCCINLSGRVSSPAGKGSSSLPKPSPELQSAGSRVVGRLGSLEKWQSKGKGGGMKRFNVSMSVWKLYHWPSSLLPTALHRQLEESHPCICLWLIVEMISDTVMSRYLNSPTKSKSKKFERVDKREFRLRWSPGLAIFKVHSICYTAPPQDNILMRTHFYNKSVTSKDYLKMTTWGNNIF